MSSTPSPSADVTQWLRLLNEGAAAGVSNELFERLYAELHRIARSHMAREQAGHTLSATALTHEAWFRMAEQTRTRWHNRAHFLAVASTMMRRILVNHAMAKRAAKREAQLVSLSLTDIALGAGMRGTELARIAQQRRPGLAILLMSGFSSELLDADRESPADWELLPKPYSRSELAQAMARALGQGR